MARLVTETDRAIIRLLQENARMSYAELSRATGIPESTVRRRMDRLQQRGVIEFAMLADPSRLGYEVRAMIGLRVELRMLEDIAETLRGMNEVTFAAFLTGNFDIMVQVVVRSQEALVEFLTKRLAPIEGLRSSETFVMPYIIKPATAWVLPEGDDDRLSANGHGNGNGRYAFGADDDEADDDDADERADERDAGLGQMRGRTPERHRRSGARAAR